MICLRTGFITRQEIQEIGRDVSGTEFHDEYERIIDRNTNPRTSYRNYAWRALWWVRYSYHYLPLEALAKAVSLGSDGRINENVDGRKLLELTNNLIITDKQGRCRFAHMSLREYVSHHVTSQEAHARIAHTCLCYIVESDLADTTDDLFYFLSSAETRTFGDYAMLYWLQHYTELSENWRNSDTLSRYFDFFMSCNPVSATFLKWGERARYASWWGIDTRTLPGFGGHARHPPQVIHPVLLACFLGFPQLLEGISLARLLEVEQSEKQTCLHIAVSLRRTECVRLLLLVEGLDAGAQNTDGLTALHMAMEAGDINMMKLLSPRITREALILKSDKGTTVLHAAAVLNDADKLRTAVEAFGCTPLRLFLDRVTPDDLAITDPHGNTALHLALKGPPKFEHTAFVNGWITAWVWNTILPLIKHMNREGLNIPNHIGLRARDLAAQAGYTGLAFFIQRN